MLFFIPIDCVFQMKEITRKPDGTPLSGSGVCWEHFPHVADVGIRGFGPTLESAFEQAALAMTAAVTDPDAIASKETIEVTCQAPNAELLLVDWLNAIVFEMATRKMLFGSFSVVIDRNSLVGKIGGESVDIERHEPATEIKGATLSELEVVREGDGRWRAQCVVDV